MKILVFDTETTGLPSKGASIMEHSKWPYIIQISYILYDISTNNILLMKDEYIKIDKSIEISEESFEKHKISREILDEKGINIIPAVREFNNTVKICDLVVGHNISFDKRMVFVESFRHKIDQYFTVYNDFGKIYKPEYCTMKNTTEYCNIVCLSKTNKTFIKTPKLTELYQILFPEAIIPQDLHNSLVDILITFRCYMKIKHNTDIVDINEYVKDLLIKYKCITAQSTPMLL